MDSHLVSHQVFTFAHPPYWYLNFLSEQAEPPDRVAASRTPRSTAEATFFSPY